MPKAWIRERKRDYYYRRAKDEKYRSRAVFKLLQAVKKYGFIKLGDVVVDLGAAPGGWLQASLEIVGEKGFVLGVDVRPIESIGQPNIRTLVGDITDPQTLMEIKEILQRLADVVISDVSPNVSGVWELDHARQIDLAHHSLRIATSVLRRGGSFFVKVFQGDMLENFIDEVEQRFSLVKLIKPKASRAKSAELYILAMDRLKLKRESNENI